MMRKGYLLTENQAGKLYAMLSFTLRNMDENKIKRDLAKFKKELGEALGIRE